MSEAEARLQRLKGILEISVELTSTVALEPLLHKIVEEAAALTDSEAASILLLDTRSGGLRFRAASGEARGQVLDIPVPVESSIAGAVLVSGEPAIIFDTSLDPRHYQAVGEQVSLETRSLLAVPLSIKEQRIGVLEAINKQEGGEFDQEDVETLTAMAAQAAVAIENARLVGALKEAYERLGELDRLKSDFISIASHELRTPLSLILLYAAMLQDQMGEAAGAQLDAVLRAAQRLQYIIETMLNLRYLETGEMRVKPSRFDLRTEVRESCADYETLAETGRIGLEADLPEDEVTVQVDREKVRVVLDNLISNAVKFTPEGGRVRVALCSRSDEVEVSVADTGVGIPPEELDNIFDRFYQVEDHMIRRHGGMGLGLAIAKGLVELHGGHIWVESVPGEGSCFFVTLPTTVLEGVPILLETQE